MKMILKFIFSQWSDSDTGSGNDLENNLGNIYQNDYEIDFRSDSEIASVSEFHIESDTEFDICSLIYRKNKSLIALLSKPLTYAECHTGNTTLPLIDFGL